MKSLGLGWIVNLKYECLIEMCNPEIRNVDYYWEELAWNNALEIS